jgi:hypothetical protein
MRICVVSTCNYYVSVTSNYFTNVWSNCPVSNVEYVHRLVNATYDRRADVLSIAIRGGEPKYVVVGRGTFAVFAEQWHLVHRPRS